MRYESAENPRLLTLRFQLNSRPVEVGCEPHETVAEVLRDRLGLTGTKVSCDVQVCGACTVLIDGGPVSACTTLAYEMRDRQVVTIEGLSRAGAPLHPVQQAFIDEFGFQCGFCTPGAVMAAKALLDTNPDPSDDEIVHHMEGNLCRCTGYLQIFNSIKRASVLMKGAVT
jgi:carbon-monoxide dehydrogenase small subunit